MTANVTVDFNANLARFSTGVEKAINDLNKFENQGKRVSASLNSAFATLGVGLSVAGLGAFIKGSIDAQDRLNDLRLTTGLTIATLSGLKFAAQVSGGDLESLAASINKLAVNMGKDAEKFKALGITAKDPLEAFKQLADVFVKIQDPQLRAALGAEALGKSWQGAAPLLMEGGKGIGELVEKGERLSGVTEESTKAADAFNDKLTELVGTGWLTNKMVGGLLPLLNTLADDLIENRDAVSDLNIEFNPLLETGRAIAVLFGNVAFVFRGVGTEIGGIAAQLAAFGRGDFAGGMAIGKMMKEDAAAARASFDEWEKKIMGLSGASPGTKGATGKPARDAALEATVAGVVGGGGAKGGKGAKTPLQTMLEAQQKRIAEMNAMAGDEQMVSVDSVSRQYAKKDEDRAHAMDELHMQRIENYRIETEGEEAVREAMEKTGEAIKDNNDFARDMGMTFSSAFEDAILSGKKLRDVLADLTKDLARIVLRKGVTEPLGGMVTDFVKDAGIGDFFKGLFKSADGNVFSSPDLHRYANTVVSSPTLFKFAQGGSFGLMGEAGAEAIMPLARGANGKLGVQASGGGGVINNVSVVVNSDGGSSQGDSTQAAELGRRIEGAVRAVLMAEKRPRGLLGAS